MLAGSTRQVSEPPVSARSSRLQHWLKRFWVPLVLVFASLALCGTVTASHTEQLSPFDEWVYYDYVAKIPTQFVVREGEAVGPAALEAMSCNGDSFGPRGEPCGGPYDDPAAYPQGGKTSADIYTPLYFAATWVMARGIQLVSGLDLLTAARYSGVVWLAIGMWLFSRIMSRFRVNDYITLGLGLLYIGSPIAVWSSTYISTDAPSFMVGAAVILALIRFVRGESLGWWLLPIAVIGVWLKAANLVAVGLMLIALIVYAVVLAKTRAGRRSAPSPARLVLVGVVVTGAALAAELVWILIRARLKVADQPNQGLGGTLNVRTVGDLIGTFFPGPLGFTSWPLPVPPFVAIPMSWLAVAGVLGYLFWKRTWGFERSFGIATAVSVTLFAPAMLIGMTIVLGTVPPVSGRYALALTPAMLVAIAFTLRNRLSRRLVVGYGGFVFLAILAYAVKAIVIKA